LGYGPGHLHLSGAHGVLWQSTGKCTFGCKNPGYALFKLHASGGLVGLQTAFKSCNVVAHGEPALFEPAHHQLIRRLLQSGSVNQCIELAMFYSQFDQVAFRGA
jgi:hypothetical protein